MEVYRMNAKKFYTIKEVASMLGVSRSLIYSQVYQKKLKVIYIGKRILVPEDALAKLIAA